MIRSTPSIPDPAHNTQCNPSDNPPLSPLKRGASGGRRPHTPVIRSSTLRPILVRQRPIAVPITLTRLGPGHRVLPSTQRPRSISRQRSLQNGNDGRSSIVLIWRFVEQIGQRHLNHVSLFGAGRPSLARSSVDPVDSLGFDSLELDFESPAAFAGSLAASCPPGRPSCTNRSGNRSGKNRIP